MRKLALAVIAVAIPYQATADDADITRDVQAGQ